MDGKNLDLQNTEGFYNPMIGVSGLVVELHRKGSATNWATPSFLSPIALLCEERKTSLLRRLQAQTLPDATPPIGKIHPFIKIAITFEPVM